MVPVVVHNNCTGAGGKDLIIEIPCGTAIYDATTSALLCDLVHPGERFIAAQGGKGGLGNQHFLSNRNRAPEYSLPGLPGEMKVLRLELKLLAEVGIIGLPNAGKSTLISSLSAARPKIADYPFTTLIPNLGVVRKPTGDGTVFADIPGLIEGASHGAGLGYDFLRHIERTKLLLHLLDATSEDVVVDFQTIQQELKTYGRGLPERSQIIALNKIDAVDRDIVDLEALATELNRLSSSPVFIISAVTRTGLDPMLQEIWRVLDEINALTAVEVVG